MIHYSIDTNERFRIYSVLAVTSVVIATATNKALDSTAFQNLAAPSALVVFAFLHTVYDRFLWKLMTKMKLSAIPDLNGDWEGDLVKNTGDGFPVRMLINQTWTKIDGHMDTTTTTGSLQVAAIHITNSSRPVAKWIYSLRPRNYALKEGYNPHAEGVNEFRVITQGDELILDGAYYSSNKRGGKITLRRPTNKTRRGEQDGADQPATAPESKPEGEWKPQTESEGRSQ